MLIIILLLTIIYFFIVNRIKILIKNIILKSVFNTYFIIEFYYLHTLPYFVGPIFRSKIHTIHTFSALNLTALLIYTVSESF